MSDPENFLTRWSRRKAAASEPDAAPEQAKSEVRAGEDGAVEDRKIESAAGAPAGQPGKAEPEIDLSTLPPIESIEASTDITAFLRAGIPAELTRAALRRAWAADPNIRDFIGLAENSWDFTAPDGIPGFGPLSPDAASRLMSEFAARAKEVATRATDVADQFIPPDEESASKDGAFERGRKISDRSEIASPSPSQDRDAILHSDSLQRETKNIALQNNLASPTENNEADSRPPRGRALPK